MDSKQKFEWTEAVQSDLICIFNASDKIEKPNWSNIASQFKKLYPKYEGTSDALRLRYQRSSRDTNFKWSEKARNDLLSIVNETKKPNWYDIGMRFRELYSNFKGKDDSLRKCYERYIGKIDNVSENLFELETATHSKKKLCNETLFKQSDHQNNLTKQESLELVRLVNLINVDGYPNWMKIWYTFKRNNPNYEGTKNDLILQYEKIGNEENYQCASVSATDNNDQWDESMDVLLAQATGHAQYIRSAQLRDGRRKVIENLAKLTVKTFKELYKAMRGLDYIGADEIILKQFYAYKESLVSSTYVCKEELDNVSNIDNKILQAFASKNHTLTFSKVFRECCHNCGFMFPRNRTSSNRKMLSYAINNSPNVVRMTNNIPYTYCIDGRFVTCIECFQNPKWQTDYSLANSKSGEYSIPKELRNLNEYEQNQIALCGGFYTVYRKQNVQRKIFEHRQGECNIGKKRDVDYQCLFTAYVNTERPQKLDASTEKIKIALRWLRKNNTLFRDFLANYETIYGYLMSCQNIRPEERLIQITKGNLNDMLGKDTEGLLIPADNIRIESEINAGCHKFGVQHPLQDNLTKLRNMISVNYSDSDLEAKRWPHLFPEGNGSWKQKISLKPQTYVKHRLLNIDPRFRKNNEFMFFWYDRLIKQRLLYYNNRQRTVNISELVAPIQAKNIRDNVTKYGTVVPSTIPGSKTYWTARKLDLLAFARDIGTPNYFVTLTQNDNWPELQEVCGKLSQEELDFLNATIMQPAIGGSSVVHFPVETVVAFYKRLDMFMRSCIHNKKGPFGEVVDYWYRIEYQNRGALHCHMILWCCEDTIPDDVVMAEMPRYCGTDDEIKHQTFIAREYVKSFQLHSCTVGVCKKDINSKCRYGFPYKIQLSEQINESKMGYTYVRRDNEDKNVVPYNVYALMCWNGHINVQKVTSNGIEAYLCKYVSKPERSIDIKDITSETEKFLKARVVGILECCAHLLQFHQVRSSRKTIFLPCDFHPKQRMLKRKSHLPSDEQSDDVYYQTLLYKYLVRPKELHNLTYVDLFRFYDVVSVNANIIHANSFDPVLTEDDSENEIRPKLDESHLDFSGRVRQIKSQRMKYISGGYKYVERGKAAVPRWRFLLPFGNESEKYYEQHLLLNVPIIEEELNDDGYPFSEGNESKTFIEECCIRRLVDSEETAKSALIGAVQRGFSIDRVIELATLFVDQSYVTKEYVDSIIIPWVESMPVADTDVEIHDEYGEELAKMVENRVKFEPYQTYFDKMTNSQKNVMEWVEHKINKEDQILAILSGGAGVGKSYITRALYSYFVEKGLVCVILATTGSAAHLISGTTVHYYLKVDIYGNRFMQAGTIAAKIIEDTDVIFIDEFSMLDYDLLNQLNETTKEFGKSKKAPMGGKHLFLIGDPCQLPAINKSVFSNPLLNLFSILLLKETVRQKDETFASLLNRIRVNKMTEEDKSILRSRYTDVSNIGYDDETLIVTATRSKMIAYNTKFIENLPGVEVVITAQDFERDTCREVSSFVKEKIRRYVRNLWDEQLVLKQGCIVRLLRNIDVSSGWVNSKRARVHRVPDDGSYIILEDLNDPSKQLPLTKIRQPFKLGANLYYRMQYPLILGYATTVHAVQGTTVSGKYYVDLDRSFWESGQAFVALSRPKELSQLFLLNTHFEKVQLKPYYSDLLEWMIKVDEIAIIRKVRSYGDFPLIPTENFNEHKNNILPTCPIMEPTVNEKLKAQFKRPGKVAEVSKSLDDLTTVERKKNYAEQFEIKDAGYSTGMHITPNMMRVYKLSEAFINICRTSTVTINKIRFGIKFLNELLVTINDMLGIYNVVDPLWKVEAGIIADEDIVRKWDEQIISSLNCFRKYTSQFRTELETFASLIIDSHICKYNGQELAHGIAVLYQANWKFQPVRTDGDGRCFYHSVSLNLIGTTILSNSLKILIAFTICNDFDIYDTIFNELASSASTVLLKALSYNCWADMEIITAMSCALQRPIIVTSGLDGEGRIQSLTYNKMESESDPIHIAHVKINKESLKANHFIAMLHDESFVASSNRLESLNEQVKGMRLDDVTEITSISLSDDDVEMLEANDSLTESL